MEKFYFKIEYNFEELVTSYLPSNKFIKDLYESLWCDIALYIVEMELLEYEMECDEEIIINIHYKKGIITKINSPNCKLISYKLKKFDIYDPKTILYLNKQGFDITPNISALLGISIYSNNYKLFDLLMRKVDFVKNKEQLGFLCRDMCILSINMCRYDFFSIMYSKLKEFYPIHFKYIIYSLVRNNNTKGLRFLVENGYIDSNNKINLEFPIENNYSYNIINNESNVIFYLLNMQYKNDYIYISNDIIIEIFLTSFYTNKNILSDLSFDILLRRGQVYLLFKDVFENTDYNYYNYYCCYEHEEFSYIKDTKETLEYIFSKCSSYKNTLKIIFNYANERELTELKFLVLKYIL